MKNKKTISSFKNLLSAKIGEQLILNKVNYGSVVNLTKKSIFIAKKKDFDIIYYRYDKFTKQIEKKVAEPGSIIWKEYSKILSKI